MNVSNSLLRRNKSEGLSKLVETERQATMPCDYLTPGMNPFIPRIILARPPLCIRFIISRICSN